MNIAKLIKIFIIWLLIHFVAYNIVTFARGLDGPIRNYLRLRKEIVIAIFLWYIVYGYHHIWWWEHVWKALWADTYMKRFQIGLIVFAIVSLLMTVFVHDLEVWRYALAFKYDILFLLIFVIWYHLQIIITHKKSITETKSNLSSVNEKTKHWDIAPWIGTVIKIMLWIALLRYMVIAIKPGTLKLLWYNNYSFEWNVGEPAPAAYYTDINQWLTRNQFLFERPTTRGFFLIAFWPLFYILYLHRKPKKHTRVRRCIYGLNIILTFSRAARWARVFQIMAMWFLLKKNKDTWTHILIKKVLPICVVLGILAYLGRDQIVHRSFSTVWHVDMLVQWREMFIQDPRRGQWAASAWPWSHRWDSTWFNPENQFLQIMIEFGLIWFGIRGLLYGSLHLLWISKKNKISSSWNGWKQKKSQDNTFTDADTCMHTIWYIAPHKKIILALCIWLVGLSISGMVLHSLSDRMVVYPFMLILGMIYASSSSNLDQKS